MKNSWWIKLSIFVVIVGGAGWGLHALGIEVSDLSPSKMKELILSFGIWAPVMYLVAYGQPIIPLPASVMTITGGLAFGPVWGTLGALVGATTRACTQFGVARLLGRETVAKLFKGKVAAVNNKIAEHGFKTVLLIRLIPNFPFDMQNYGLGFSKVRFTPFALATFLGMIPGSFAFVYLGYSITEPKHIWKLGVAILLIIGLMVATSKMKKPKGAPSTP